MNRFFALIGALLLAFISISSACTAAPADGSTSRSSRSAATQARLKASFRERTTAATVITTGRPNSAGRADRARPCRVSWLPVAARSALP